MIAKILVVAVTIAAVILSQANSYPTIENNTLEIQGDKYEELDKREIMKRETRGLLIKDRIEVVIENGKECVYFNDDNRIRQFIRCDIPCGTKTTLKYFSIDYGVSFGCASDEENFQGLCYKKCSLLANANYPRRTATNTCAKNGCGPDEEKDASLCYPKCRAHYNGIGPVCWGHCDHFCPGHADHGVHCYRWWPPHSCHKPSYGRGAGTLPHAPWTNGLGCNGFGVDTEGGCAKIDVSDKFSQLKC